ncbi:hypothetical protein HXW73_03190 [Halomonas sp. SH5A2]|uniref:hypothetical protein n=1 Tax=Halomonas sp. SH5A2 TaxID=2749040 RepID=UPI0016407385|nr:hypothetical protein [Halomonas sp. SH5A2]QNI02019.1 hypothetical protein HXW73_03190 [Halomonas sp. SH5A2]
MEEARAAFQQILKMAILFGGVAIFYVWIENKFLKSGRKKDEVETFFFLALCSSG